MRCHQINKKQQPARIISQWIQIQKQCCCLKHRNVSLWFWHAYFAKTFNSQRKNIFFVFLNWFFHCFYKLAFNSVSLHFRPALRLSSQLRIKNLIFHLAKNAARSCSSKVHQAVKHYTVSERSGWQRSKAVVNKSKMIRFTSVCNPGFTIINIIRIIMFIVLLWKVSLNPIDLARWPTIPGLCSGPFPNLLLCLLGRLTECEDPYVCVSSFGDEISLS